MPRLSSWLEAAVCHHHQGDLVRAEELYRKILKKRSDHPAALHMLGVLASQTGRVQEATLLLAQSIELEPEVDSCLDLGRIFEDQCRFEAALCCYRQAVDLEPMSPVPWEKLAQFFDRVHRYEDSSAAWAHRIRMEPEDRASQSNVPSNKNLLRFHWANSLALAGHRELARSQYKLVVEQTPGFLKGLFYLAVIETQLGNTAESILLYEQLLVMDPSHSKGWNNLGILRQVFGRLNAAISCYEKALAADPGYSQASYNLATALQQTDRLEDAAAMYEQLLALEVYNEPAMINYGNTLLSMNRVREAIGIFEQVVATNKNEPASRYNRGLARLVLGDLKGGFADYEARFELPETPKRQFPVPLWTTQKLQGRTILVWSEQGLGDTLQFIRFAAVLSGLGAKVVVECPRGLAGLLKTVAGIGQVLVAGSPLPSVDFHVPILSLPHRLGTTLDSIPAQQSYLTPSVFPIEELDMTRPKVGLVWAGNPNHKNDRNRSMPQRALECLEEIDGIQFVSLQKDLPPAEMPPMADVRHHMADFESTGSIIAQLDLVISVDTAMAHLAGALGRPIWLMLPYCPDWRWMLGSDDSPWYPSMHIFRQKKAQDWESVIDPISQRLRELVKLRA